MTVLLITSKEEDYLQDSIIHGFKELLGKDAIDYPVKEILYNDYTNEKKIRGNGFTLYRLLGVEFKNSIDINIEESISKNQFDLIVFTSIYRQYNFFYKHLYLLMKSSSPVWIMDGEDSPVLFPYLGKHIKKFMAAIKPHKHFRYFKRELLPETLDSIYLRFPVSKLGKSAFPKNIQPVAFSIPDEKIIRKLPAKKKMFTTHIVDAEVAGKVYGRTQQKLFDTEWDYYHDIQESKFGITTKRAGWDCLRHYEIAANGTVLCFKDLDKKPASCAPHGLIDGQNCIVYSDYASLMLRVNKLSETEYESLQCKGWRWAQNNSTIARVKGLINIHLASAN